MRRIQAASELELSGKRIERWCARGQAKEWQQAVISIPQSPAFCISSFAVHCTKSLLHWARLDLELPSHGEQRAHKEGWGLTKQMQYETQRHSFPSSI